MRNEIGRMDKNHGSRWGIVKNDGCRWGAFTTMEKPLGFERVSEVRWRRWVQGTTRVERGWQISKGESRWGGLKTMGNPLVFEGFWR